MKTTPEPERSRGATHGTLELIAALADEWKLKTLQPQIAACRQLAQSRNGIDVAVFGRFKAGKSSFLNHLAGRAVLPVGVVPLTAVITRLRSGERARGEVRFLDGTTREIPLADVGLYVSENHNPKNAKRVEAVEIELPELRPLAPLQFVDTPGLGSALAHNTEVALNWLPQVGAALVAVSADAPLSERDLELLGELRRHTPKIALLLTKADLLTEAQRAEVRAFIAAQLRRSTAPASSPVPGQRQPPGDPGRITASAASNGELPIFFYSIKPELSTMRSAVLEELLEPLRARHGQTGEEIFRHKLVSLRDQLLNYLRVALAAATQVESARAALQDKLAEERRQFALFREELAIFTRAQSAGALNESLERLRPVRTALQAKLATELDAQWPRWRMRLPPLLEAWRNWLNEWLRRELSGVSRTQQAVFRAPLERSRAHLTRALQAFHDRLADHVRAALGVTLAPREFNLEVREPDAPPVRIAYAFDAAFTSIGWLIPLTLFRGPIERVLRRKARWEVEKNLSRLAADWRERVDEVIGEMRLQTERAAQSELDALEQMLAQTASDAPRLREQIATLAGALEP